MEEEEKIIKEEWANPEDAPKGGTKDGKNVWNWSVD